MTNGESGRTSSNHEPDSRLYHVAGTDVFEPGSRVIIEIEGREIAVFTLDDEYYALLNYCVHQGGPVCEGTVSGTLTAEIDGDGWALGYEHENRIISCPWHGWEFDIVSGEHLANPRYRLPTFEVVVRDDDVYVKM